MILRLLTPLPRIDGLAEPLPTKRARRAIELVAYLALHRPHPVTTDRLRTRVLGSSDLDAAAKTLFNTAAAARKALGPDEQGRPLLPPAGRSGRYTVEDRVTVDTLELEHLVHRAAAETDLATQIDLLRRALALIEGEPMAAVMGGYEWWAAEGHAARTACVVVDAACHLANVATSAGLPALAAWGITQARLVEAYSEALSRAAMRSAAAAGDADLLRREWHECCRQVDELDPGAMPSEETELLYTRLVRRSPTTETDYASLPAMEPAPRSTVPSAPAAL
jgi:DNA-binding SARP family transcriptional activator